MSFYRNVLVALAVPAGSVSAHPVEGAHLHQGDMLSLCLGLALISLAGGVAVFQKVRRG